MPYKELIIILDVLYALPAVSHIRKSGTVTLQFVPEHVFVRLPHGHTELDDRLQKLLMEATLEKLTTPGRGRRYSASTLTPAFSKKTKHQYPLIRYFIKYVTGVIVKPLKFIKNQPN